LQNYEKNLNSHRDFSTCPAAVYPRRRAAIYSTAIHFPRITPAVVLQSAARRSTFRASPPPSCRNPQHGAPLSALHPGRRAAICSTALGFREEFVFLYT